VVAFSTITAAAGRGGQELTTPPHNSELPSVEEQLRLFDDAPYITPAPLARAGSQRWIQVAVNSAPEMLLQVLRPALGLGVRDHIVWRSPLASHSYREYRDMPSLHRLGIWHLPHRSLCEWWPRGGPVWDALGNTSDGQLIFLEAKAHIGEIFSPPTRATPASHKIIERSLLEARQHYSPSSRASWDSTFFQYANRLAWHYWLHTVNGLPSHMVFLYFCGAREMPNAPESQQAWERPIRYLHRRLGLPDFHPPDVHSVFLDVEPLAKLAPLQVAPEPVKNFEPPWRSRLIDSLKG
jgi:hypothetical protein